MNAARNAAHIPPRAIVLISGSVLCFTLLDTTIKYLTQFMPVSLLVWARWSIQVVAMLLWLGPSMGRGLVRTTRLRLHLVRGAILLSSSFCFVTALRYLPLADATAINYSTPILVAVMAVFILHEKLTRARIGFVLAGFAGMLLIARPGSEILTAAALLAMASAAFYATFQILTRKLAGEDPRVLLFIPALVGTALMTLTLPWIEFPAHVAWQQVVLLVVGSLLGTLGAFPLHPRVPARSCVGACAVHLHAARLGDAPRVVHFRRFPRGLHARRHGRDRDERPLPRGARAAPGAGPAAAGPDHHRVASCGGFPGGPGPSSPTCVRIGQTTRPIRGAPRPFFFPWRKT